MPIGRPGGFPPRWMFTPASGRWSGHPVSGQPKLVVAGYAVFTVLVCVGLKDLWYDHNLLNLQAEGLESVKLEKTLLRSDCGASFAAVMAKSREELLLRKAMYANRELCPMVDSVEEIGSYVPEDWKQKQPLIQHIHDCLANARLPKIDAIPVVPPAQLLEALAKLQEVMAAMGRAREAQQLQRIRDLVRSLPQRRVLPAPEHLPNEPGGRHAAGPVCPADRLESRAAGPDRLSRRPRFPAGRPQRVLLPANSYQGRHLEHDRDGGVRPPIAGRRRQGAPDESGHRYGRDGQSGASLRVVAGDDVGLREGRFLRRDDRDRGGLARLPQHPHDPPGPLAAGHLEIATLRPDGPAGHSRSIRPT